MVTLRVFHFRHFEAAVASGHLELGSRSRVRGNLHYGLMEMAMGAQIEGRLCRLQDEARPLELPQPQDAAQ